MPNHQNTKLGAPSRRTMRKGEWALGTLEDQHAALKHALKCAESSRRVMFSVHTVSCYGGLHICVLSYTYLVFVLKQSFKPLKK